MKPTLRLMCVALAVVLCPMPMGHAAEPASPAPAETLTVDQLLDNMEKVRQTVKTFKANVTKVRQVEVLDETEKFQGTIQFKTPRLLRMELKSDASGKETLYVVGPEFGWIYRPQEKQAERVRLKDIADDKKSGNPLEFGLAKDMHGLKEGFALKVLPPEKLGDVQTAPLEMTPNKDNSYAGGKVVFWVDTTRWMPVQVREYKSNNEIIETHSFANIEINKSVSDKLFEFTPAKGVDVIIHDAN